MTLDNGCSLPTSSWPFMIRTVPGCKQIKHQTCVDNRTDGFKRCNKERERAACDRLTSTFYAACQTNKTKAERQPRVNYDKTFLPSHCLLPGNMELTIQAIELQTSFFLPPPQKPRGGQQQVDPADLQSLKSLESFPRTGEIMLQNVQINKSNLVLKVDPALLKFPYKPGFIERLIYISLFMNALQNELKCVYFICNGDISFSSKPGKKSLSMHNMMSTINSCGELNNLHLITS